MLAIVLEFSAVRLQSLFARHAAAVICRISLTPCLDGLASESVFPRTDETDRCREVVTMPAKGIAPVSTSGLLLTAEVTLPTARANSYCHE
jgi:hypothetical protein